MAGITLAQAEAQLASWLAASTAVAAKQSYTIGNRQLSFADSAEILKNVEYWDAKVKALESGRSGIRIRGITPA
jgi:hypothetical protein